MAPPEPAGFDPPDKLDALVGAVRRGAASSAVVGTFQAPVRNDSEDVLPGYSPSRVERISASIAG